ncbi:amino acid ABC transporter permease [Muricoccus radiodurans]|uniref:amino acid ABC transporter permease n=1 Tax=Muricoccus radiodurans TaxID=2231721 RepID=UPI003CEC5170
MSQTTIDPRHLRAPPKKKLTLSWADERVRAIVWQVLIVGAVVGIVWWLVRNTQHNLEVRRIATGFGFLTREAGLPIGESLIEYTPANNYLRALTVGVLNTLKVAVVGVILATILGTLVGIARLSKNWLLSKIAAVYVEVIRDIPLLLQLLFWYTILQSLPPPRGALNPVTGVFLSNRGLKLPWLDWEVGHSWALLAFVAGAFATWLFTKEMRKRQMADGQPRPIWPAALGFLVGLPLVVWVVGGAPVGVEWPERRGFNFVGGLTISPEYFALLVGLVTYTAGFIAEIVRAGILAVAKGQWEAAQALGLRPGTVLRRIVLPQALRVIVPPMTSQYLNLTKNSSLAVAIGYQDIVSIANTTLNQTGQAIEGIAIIMLVYLTISLSISFFMNWYNSRIALVER